MRNCIIIFLGICCINICNAQQDWTNLPESQYVIHIDAQDVILGSIGNFSNNYLSREDNCNKCSRQVLEYQIIFHMGTNYILPIYQSQYQTYWNKVTRIQTDAVQKENYISLGWRYNNWESNTPSKIEMGIYAHRNHSYENNRRIFTKLNSTQLFTPNNIQLALTKELMYCNINGSALLSIKDANSWSSNDDLETQMNSYFGDPWYFDLTIEELLSLNFTPQYNAPNDLNFFIYDCKLNRTSFWTNSEFTKASNELKIAHSRLKSNFPYRNFIAPTIYLSYKCENTNNAPNYTNEESFPSSNIGSFFIVEGYGSPVSFKANEIIIGGNTLFETGTNIYIGP